ncbi:MAG TPA: rhamnan synthesis F family protein, partial [Chitinophagaceae bacterium]
SWQEIFLPRLKTLEKFSPQLLVNLWNNQKNIPSLVKAIHSDFPQSRVILTPNKGRDVGGKLALIDFYLKTAMQSDYLVLLHDKKSPHMFEGKVWREKLFRIIDQTEIPGILSQFETNPQTGIIGATELIRNEYQGKKFTTINNDKLNELIGMYQLNMADHRFVAGTMFWIRSSIIKSFFSRFPALACRELLEEGNFTDHLEGKYTHSWERVFGWLATSQGFSLKGI